MNDTQKQMLVAARALIDSIIGDTGAAQDTYNPAIADARDLDGKYGNPIIKFDPRDWAGDSFKNRSMSECPADYLDLVANAFEWFAKKAQAADERTASGKPVADFKRKDAARARGWAKRIRGGWKPETFGAPAADASPFQSFDVSSFEDVTNDNDVPF